MTDLLQELLGWSCLVLAVSTFTLTFAIVGVWVAFARVVKRGPPGGWL